MPVNPTYPGVYIEEISSGVRTIAGVATSIAAFVGWAPQGRDDQPAKVTSWGDYERRFGGLHPQSRLSYGVYHFFLNGGQEAYIVRLTSEDAEYATTAAGPLTIKATGKGTWAHRYAVRIMRRADVPNRFSLSVLQIVSEGDPLQTALVESFDDLSLHKDDPRYAKLILDENSAIIDGEIPGDADGAPDNADLLRLEGGVDGVALQPNDQNFWAEAHGKPDGGIWRLQRVDIFNLMCVPGLTDSEQLGKLIKFCRDQRAFLIADCAADAGFDSLRERGAKDLSGDNMINAAFYYPWLKASDPFKQGRIGEFPPCGAVAGTFARTDVQRGVWKAPAGVDASLTGVRGVKTPLTDIENGELNIRAVNCIRSFPVYGTVVWGARTLRGHNEIGSEWKYIPVRRTALYIEESLYRGLKWVVFEPNDEPLWSQIRLNVGAFMNGMFRQGAFQGRSPREAYLVKCDSETTTQNDINLGIVNIVVGFAPLKPAEFVIVKIQQLAAEIEV